MKMFQHLLKIYSDQKYLQLWSMPFNDKKKL
jgi:hypothetical protein